MPAHWYALHVKPHKERAVYQLLLAPDGFPSLAEEDGSLPYKVFFPSVRVKPKNPRAAKVRPFFPGYMFVFADLEKVGVNAFNWIPGARGLVDFGGEAAVVPEALINELKERVVRIEAAGGIVVEAFEPGEKVRIVSGPLAGYDAIFDMQLAGSDRVQILLSFLSQHPQRIKIDIEDIVKVKKK